MDRVLDHIDEHGVAVRRPRLRHMCDTSLSRRHSFHRIGSGVPPLGDTRKTPPTETAKKIPAVVQLMPTGDDGVGQSLTAVPPATATRLMLTSSRSQNTID